MRLILQNRLALAMMICAATTQLAFGGPIQFFGSTRLDTNFTEGNFVGSPVYTLTDTADGFLVTAAVDFMASEFGNAFLDLDFFRIVSCASTSGPEFTANVAIWTDTAGSSATVQAGAQTYDFTRNTGGYPLQPILGGSLPLPMVPYAPQIIHPAPTAALTGSASGTGDWFPCIEPGHTDDQLIGEQVNFFIDNPAPAQVFHVDVSMSVTLLPAADIPPSDGVPEPEPGILMAVCLAGFWLAKRTRAA